VRAAQPPAVLQVSLDATKVPLVGGGWTDVKLAVFADLALGPPLEDGPPTLAPQTTSYVARWEPAARFGETITLEAQRRRLEEAGVVVSPNDGAEWIQGIPDFPHAIEHLGAVATLVHGEGSAEAAAWVAAQRKALHDRGPDRLLLALTACQVRGPCASALADAERRTPQERLQREVAYFTSRVGQLAYPAFRQHGYPIGSGAVESGHKVVIGARFKGAGQHWVSHHLNPLLVLRCASCNARRPGPPTPSPSGSAARHAWRRGRRCPRSRPHLRSRPPRPRLSPPSPCPTPSW